MLDALYYHEPDVALGIFDAIGWSSNGARTRAGMPLSFLPFAAWHPLGLVV
jgi:hypothetical protein